RGWKYAIGIAQKNSAVSKIENSHAHHAIESGSDFFNARLEFFPEQIAAGIARCFRFRLAKSACGQCKRNKESDEFHCNDIARSTIAASRLILERGDVNTRLRR